MKNLIISLLLFPIFIFPQQTAKLVKIIDANIFMFSDSSIVKLHGLYIPSIEDEDLMTRELAKKIIKDEEINFLNNTFKIEFMDNDKTEANLFKEYLASYVNIAEWLLVNGYAYLKKENKYLSELFPYQKQAMNNKRGLWTIQEKMLDIEVPKVKKEISLMPLLSVSIAFGVLAYDNFSTSSDLQKQIDNFKSFSNRIDVSGLESMANRRFIVGLSSLVAALITAFLSFNTIEITPDANNVNLRINY